VTILIPIQSELPFDYDTFGWLWMGLNYISRPDVVVLYLGNEATITVLLLLSLHFGLILVGIFNVYWYLYNK
jgi:hypothetical protein